jgi:hypothetical protein
LLFIKYKIKIFFKKSISAKSWWLTPVILATQEAEVRRIMVQSQPHLKKTHHNKGLAE